VWKQGSRQRPNGSRSKDVDSIGKKSAEQNTDQSNRTNGMAGEQKMGWVLDEVEVEVSLRWSSYSCL